MRGGRQTSMTTVSIGSEENLFENSINPSIIVIFESWRGGRGVIEISRGADNEKERVEEGDMGMVRR